MIRSATLPDTRDTVDQLRRYPTLLELRRSRYYARNRAALATLLGTPLGGGRGLDFPAPARLRLVQWNIEKGRRVEAIGRAMREHPELSRADLLFVNEVDVGMARSGNRNVAADLAELLGMTWVFAPAHLELTKGVGADLDATGDNTIGLQGNAILSRYRLTAARVIPLPVCFEAFEFHEKRFGRRAAVVATLATEFGDLTLAGTHLEVRDTPQCRARQMQALLAALPAGPAVVAGDFNCSTFERGNLVRTVRGVLRLFGNPERLRADLRRPQTREPLFRALAAAGFGIEGWNTDDMTIVERVEGLEDAAHLPGPVRRAVLARLDRLGRRLEFRLDWFAGRGLHARRAMTLPRLYDEDGERLSDHAPIVVDVDGV